MITQNTVRIAMKLLEEAQNTSIYSANSNIKKTQNDQIALSLKVYLERGEYEHGNLNQAMDCLSLAGYEIK